LKGEKEKMKIPLSEKEYKALEEMGKEDGLTVDQEAQAAILYMFKKLDVASFDELKKRADPKVLEVLERGWPK